MDRSMHLMLALRQAENAEELIRRMQSGLLATGWRQAAGHPEWDSPAGWQAARYLEKLRARLAALEAAGWEAVAAAGSHREAVAEELRRQLAAEAAARTSLPVFTR